MNHYFCKLVYIETIGGRFKKYESVGAMYSEVKNTDKIVNYLYYTGKIDTVSLSKIKYR